MGVPAGIRFPLALRVAVIAASLVGTALVAGCAKPASEAPPAGSSATNPEQAPTSEAEKTRELEEKAQGYQDRFQEIQASDMSAEEKARAASELVDEQQRTIQESESTGEGDDPN
jgi:hypothetical protein